MTCDQPAPAIAHAIAAINQHSTIASALAALPLSPHAMVGAVDSFSAQASEGSSDPRLLLTTADGCLVFTFTLLGDSLEIGVLHQYATTPLPTGGFDPATEGEILVSMKPFPHTAPFAPSAVVSHFDASADRGDSNGCTGCHLEPGPLELGQKPLTLAGSSFAALVNPVSGETGGLCVPSDLQLIYDCACGRAPAPSDDCSALAAPQPAPGSEACQRLAFVLSLEPVADPAHTGDQGGCLSRQGRHAAAD